MITLLIPGTSTMETGDKYDELETATESPTRERSRMPYNKWSALICMYVQLLKMKTFIQEPYM